MRTGEKSKHQNITTSRQRHAQSSGNNSELHPLAAKEQSAYFFVMGNQIVRESRHPPSQALSASSFWKSQTSGYANKAMGLRRPKWRIKNLQVKQVNFPATCLEYLC